MKKMTNKEFKQALNEAELNFDCFNYEGILNMLSILADYREKEALCNGMLAIAKVERKRANKLFEILNERGYYNI